MRSDERMCPLWQRTLDLVTPGTGVIMGEFSRLKIYAHVDNQKWWEIKTWQQHRNQEPG